MHAWHRYHDLDHRFPGGDVDVSELTFVAGRERHNLRDRGDSPGLDLYYAGPAHHIVTAG